ncbi:hypothetical protein HCN44_010885 [Aphidius gifuensis]|uniref:RING-type domain-containing protein n=1 Tax=Aphidius gifuensis TaxID=684658 RepID=A0A835CP39_APHGI|nr:hypothetical protein HCN44_010885 [Aphidius gifuensis]
MVIPERQIQRLWRLFETDQIDIVRFLAVGSTMMDSYLDLIVYQNAFRADQFEPINMNNLVHEIPIQNNVDYVNGNELFLPLHLDIYQRRLRQRGAMENADGQNNVGVDDGGGVNGANADDANIDGVNNANIDGAHAEGANNNLEPLPPQNNYEWRCQRCLIRPKNMIIQPCNCLSHCQACVEQIRREQGPANCPNCNRRVTEFVRVYLPSTQNPDDPYDWVCQICTDQPIKFMSTTCHQLMACENCVNGLIAANPNRPMRCPFCNVPGDMAAVLIPRVVN